MLARNEKLPKCLLYLHFHVFVGQLVTHHDGELGEVQLAVVIHVDLVHDANDKRVILCTS